MGTRWCIRRSRPTGATWNPVGPRSVYDEAKRFSEAAVTAYHRYHGVNTHLVRIFNTYGPRLQANDGRVISNFMIQALQGEALTIYGDGSQTRGFCFVSDLIEGIVRLSRSDEHLPVNSRRRSNTRFHPSIQMIGPDRAMRPGICGILGNPGNVFSVSY
jgi:nucleoside-diphosphate-sugar epimerase